ncbi:MAG TPA: VTT domain-containing protein [Gemmatimonadaceae bacterium]|nr:VTT domain-containing protein [Gemmatimonadaceae bacterium]
MIVTFAVPHTLLSRLSHIWGYVSLGATSIIAEEAAPVLAGFAAHQGHLHAVRAMIACAVGSWVADLALYGLGFTRAASAVSRWRWLAAPTERLLGAVRRHPWRASLATRFAYGARLILPITCGTARIRPATYLIGSCASAFTWSALFTGMGWVFGRTAVELVGHVRRHEDLLAIVLMVAVSIGVWLFTRRNEKRVVEEIGGREDAAGVS